MKRSAIVLVVLVLVAAAILYYYYFWRKAAPPAPGEAPALVLLLPADADYVFYADAAALRASPFVQELLAALPAPKEDPDYADFVRRTGFDYTRDLDRIAVAVSSRVEGSKGRKDESLVAIADGRFDRERILAYARESAKLLSPAADEETYVFSSRNPDEETVLTFLSAGRIALARQPKLRDVGAPAGSSGVRASANQAGRTPVLPPASSLNERISRVAGAELFAVAHVSPLPTHLLPPGIVSGELKKTLESIQWLTLAARPAKVSPALATRPSPAPSAVEGSLTVVLEAECTSPGAARNLSWQLEGLRVLARIALSDPKSTKEMDPALAALLATVLKEGKISTVSDSSLTPDASGRPRGLVRLTFSLGPTFLAALKQPPAPPKRAR